MSEADTLQLTRLPYLSMHTKILPTTKLHDMSTSTFSSFCGLVTLCLSLGLTSCDYTPKQVMLSSEAAEDIIQALVQGVFDDVWGGIDTAAVRRYQTHDFYILEQGEVWDNTDIKEYMLQQKARPDRPTRINRMQYIHTEVLGDAIITAYDNYATFYEADTLAGQAHWLESAVAVATPEGWRLRSMHSTRVRD